MKKTDATKERQQAIQAAIKKFTVSDQHQLVRILADHYGIDTNQAAASRDLRKLGIVKKMHKGILAYEAAEIDVKKAILQLAVLDIVHNETMIVIKTYPGIADFVGDCLDKCEDLEMLACLAGENVIFVTPVSMKRLKVTFEGVCEKLHFKRKTGKGKDE